MLNTTELKNHVFALIVSLLEDTSLNISDNTPLIGDGRILDSMRLVELCLLLEDMAIDQGFEFDWQSGDAMSRSRSMFRSAGSLADEFISQAEANNDCCYGGE